MGERVLYIETSPVMILPCCNNFAQDLHCVHAEAGYIQEGIHRCVICYEPSLVLLMDQEQAGKVDSLWGFLGVVIARDILKGAF